jgi:hypothetical protein
MASFHFPPKKSSGGGGGGGAALTAQAVSSNISLQKDYVYFVNTTAARSLTLPSSPAGGDHFYIKDVSGLSNTNAITLVRTGSETIEGVAANKLLNTDFAAWMLVADSSGNWWII